MGIDRILKSGFIEVTEIRDGVLWRRSIAPGSDLTGYPEEIKAAAADAWTQEILDQYQGSLT